MKNNILETAREAIGREKTKNRKEWLTVDITEKIEKIKELKQDHSKEGIRLYRALRNKINKEARKVKYQYLEDRCKELEVLIKEHKQEIAYKTVKQFVEG